MTYMQPKGYLVLRVALHEDDVCEVVTWRETREEAEQYIAEHPPTAMHDVRLLVLHGDFTVGDLAYYDGQDES